MLKKKQLEELTDILEDTESLTFIEISYHELLGRVRH